MGGRILMITRGGRQVSTWCPRKKKSVGKVRWENKAGSKTKTRTSVWVASVGCWGTPCDGGGGAWGDSLVPVQ